MHGILVTGGAGYIGSATVEHFLRKAKKWWCLTIWHGGTAPPRIRCALLSGASGRPRASLQASPRNMTSTRVSISRRLPTWESQLPSPRSILKTMWKRESLLWALLINAGVKRVVFSSTCATYGEPEQMPISETCPQWPKNPYGWSKFIWSGCLRATITPTG